MTIGLNIGAGVHWSRTGWSVVDHKRSLLRRGGSAWATAFPARHFDLVFSSHLLEHIPHFKVDAFLSECNRVLKPGGGIRLLCPNLAVIARAYVEGDDATFAALTHEDQTIRDDLGHGGRLANFVVSPGSDSLLLSRSGECIGGYAHVYAYDFAMLRVLLERNGFGDVRQCEFGESRYAEWREPLHPVGTEPVWRDQHLWPPAPQGLTGFDRNPVGSLVVEAEKTGEAKTAPLTFGAGAARGLNANQFDWISITRAYLHFSLVKVIATLRRIAAGIRRRLR